MVVVKDNMDLNESLELQGHDKNRKMIFNCNLCNYTTTYKFNLTRHVKKVHDKQQDDNPIFICEICGKELRSKFAQKLHMKSVHEKVFKFTCNICNKGYNQLQPYMGHLASHHDVLKEKCDICSATFNHKTALKAHKQAVHENRIFKCPEPSCFAIYHSSRPLRDHIKAEHNNERLTCDKCTKTFKWRSSLKYHKTTAH